MYIFFRIIFLWTCQYCFFFIFSLCLFSTICNTLYRLYINSINKKNTWHCFVAIIFDLLEFSSNVRKCFEWIIELNYIEIVIENVLEWLHKSYLNNSKNVENLVETVSRKHLVQFFIYLFNNYFNETNLQLLSRILFYI